MHLFQCRCHRNIYSDVEGVYDLPASIQVDGKVSIPIELSIPAEDMLQGDIYIPDLKELAQSFAAPFENIFRLFLGPLGSWIPSLIDSAIAQIKDPNFGPDCWRYSAEKIRCQLAPLPALQNGVGARLTEHVLKHTTCTMLVRSDMNVAKVQAFVGHAAITSTMRYVSISDAEASAEAAQRLMRTS